MKHLRLIVLSVLLSLLFTSCLADILNEQFGFTPPVILTYESNWGKKPSRTKHPSGEPLTQEELPVLSEQGWDFGGWYTDSDYNNPVTEGTILSENTKLYAKWIPRTDTPFTIINYFMNPRETGSYEFIHRPEYDQHLTGTTDQVISSEYDIRWMDVYFSELEPYRSFYQQDDNERRIKGDGSTILYNYYYLAQIYDYEFSPILSVLPELNIFYFFELLDTGSSLDFSSIKNVIDSNSKFSHSFYDQARDETIYVYSKQIELALFNLSFTEIPSYAFSNTLGLAGISLPSTCTQIGQGAFCGCDNLNYLSLSAWDDTKTWVCSNGMDLGSYPNSQTLMRGSNKPAHTF